MWTPGSPVLDEPITKFGFALEDWCILVVVLIGGFFVLPTSILGRVAALGLTVVAGVGVYFGKRGKPPGAIFHWLHIKVWPWLPGVFSSHLNQRYGPG